MTSQLRILIFAVIFLSVATLLWPPARNLEYEYTIMLSWLYVFVLPLFAYFVPKNGTYVGPTRHSFWLLAGLPILAYLPGWFMFRFGFCQCVEMGFSFWFVLLVVPALWLGTASYFGIIRVRDKARLHLLYASLPMMLGIMSLSLLWFFPQKRINSIGLGFLHGPIYDRWIPLDYGVVIGRLGHAFFALAIFCFAARHHRIRSGSFVFLMTLSSFLIGISWRADSGGHGFSALERSLPKTVAKGDVVLHFSGERKGDDVRANSLLRDALFHVHEIKSFLNVQLSNPIHIYAYGHQNQKKILFGGGDTDITDVWTPSIHIEFLPGPHPTLRHELVHAVSSHFGWHGIGFHPNMLLTEGLAMALAPMEQDLDFDVVAAGLIQAGHLKSLDYLASPIGFWQESGQKSYYLAGSFLRWLHDRYGGSAVKNIYSGQSFLKATGEPTSAIFNAWSRGVIAAYDEKKTLVIERFTRDPGVLQDVCPHSFVDLERSRKDGFLTSLRQPSGWDPAKLKRWSLERFPESLLLRIEELDQEIAQRLKYEKFEQVNYNDLILRVEGVRRWPARSLEDLTLALMQADLEFLSGQTTQARYRLSELSKAFAKQDPGTQLRRQLDVRLALNEQIHDLERIKKWLKYLSGWVEGLPEKSNLSWIEQYLTAKRLPDPGKIVLDDWWIKVKKPNKYPAIRREWLKVIARGYTQIEDFKSAEVAYKNLSELSLGESKRLALENARRMAFLQSTSVGLE